MLGAVISASTRLSRSHLTAERVYLNSLWYVKENEDDEKIMSWTDTKTDTEEITLYVFAGDAIFEQVNNTNGGRVYYLHFQSFEDRYFFWMQEPDETKDKDFVKQLNELINSDLEEQEPVLPQVPAPQGMVEERISETPASNNYGDLFNRLGMSLNNQRGGAMMGNQKRLLISCSSYLSTINPFL